MNTRECTLVKAIEALLRSVVDLLSFLFGGGSENLTLLFRLLIFLIVLEIVLVEINEETTRVDFKRAVHLFIFNEFQ